MSLSMMAFILFNFLGIIAMLYYMLRTQERQTKLILEEFDNLKLQIRSLDAKLNMRTDEAPPVVLPVASNLPQMPTKMATEQTQLPDLGMEIDTPSNHKNEVQEQVSSKLNNKASGTQAQIRGTSNNFADNLTDNLASATNVNLNDDLNNNLDDNLDNDTNLDNNNFDDLANSLAMDLAKTKTKTAILEDSILPKVDTERKLLSSKPKLMPVPPPPVTTSSDVRNELFRLSFDDEEEPSLKSGKRR